MNPKPFSSLNHFTVPVAIWSSLPGGRVLRDAGGARATTTDAGTASPDGSPRTIVLSVACGRAAGTTAKSSRRLTAQATRPGTARPVGHRGPLVEGEHPALLEQVDDALGACALPSGGRRRRGREPGARCAPRGARRRAA